MFSETTSPTLETICTVRAHTALESCPITRNERVNTASLWRILINTVLNSRVASTAKETITSSTVRRLRAEDAKLKGTINLSARIRQTVSLDVSLNSMPGRSKQHGMFTTKRQSSVSELISFKRQRPLDRYTSVNLNISVQSPEHSDKTWFAIDESVRGGLLPGSSSPHCNYPEIIDEHGGVEKVTESLIHLIGPHIIQFQGHEVTRTALNAIICQQSDSNEPWNMPLGYASIVCDDRDTSWWRLYIGQCSLSWRRIVCQHAQQIIKGSTASLYYFNLWIGNGHRYARFIKLWGFPKNTVTDGWYQACSNLLEALFCRAFRTHHGMLNRLGSKYQNDGKASTLGWGLNIMSPLVQGNLALNKELRTKANIGPSKAPDRQIQYWAVFNSRQKAAAEKKRRKESIKAVFEKDFDIALQIALNNDEEAFNKIRESLQLQQETSNFSEDLAHIPFCGSLTSEVAAILDYAAVSGANDTPMRASNIDDEQQMLTIPWSLDGCGFTEENILIWTYDFKSFTSIGLKHLGHDILTYPDARKFHETLLANSQAKIIFLYGPQSEKLIRAIYDIRPFFCENSRVIGYILRQARKERLGGEPLTANTVDEAEDIKEIEKIAGSLTRGLLMVLKFLPRRPKSDGNESKERSPQPSRRATERVRVHESFDVEQYQKIGDFVHKHLDERESPRPQDKERCSTSSDKGGTDAPSTDPESIAALKCFSQWQGQAFQTGAAEMKRLVEQCQAEAGDRDYEAPIDILHGLAARVIGEGFLDPVGVTAAHSVIAGASDKKRQGVKSVVWKNEDVRNREYIYKLKDQLKRHIYIYYCEILFPANMDILDEMVFIKLELCPAGEIHTSLYATSSSEAHDDPALSLAFRVRYIDTFSREVVYYATNPAINMVFRANTLVEVLEKKSLEDISQFPRRFIHIGSQNNAHPLLERFRRGGNTSPLPR
ncbi:uncharacterized protein BO87DRAFT_410362 [Aspergillus neoniger CBS 115656]|uniref:Uncharacterized protein n=1 Tax=Aspergillus neoniger (strain CBS 115656) TaxID=1448310 RepID=A0A318Y5P5_ASPNB|nr:hypothetical protein BO87DRAFT_410362 [Aspergillus neoniger CBS 115656]PYH29585.1 hypothetical protein BO87DRAFT_410362 [Aspergillus neoniger CBS 115656]